MNELPVTFTFNSDRNSFKGAQIFSGSWQSEDPRESIIIITKVTGNRSAKNKDNIITRSQVQQSEAESCWIIC